MDLLQKLLTTPYEFFVGYGGPFVLVLSVLVFVHEWGHYIIARLCGVKIETFSIGFGKELFGWTDKRGTRWKFSLIPLGGYVQMFGDVDPASTQKAEGVQENGAVRTFTAEERKVAFFNQSVGKRAAIVVAGPAINFIFAILILVGLYTAQGQPYTPAIAATVKEGMPAIEAGVMPDDKIVAVNEEPIVSFQDLVKVVSLNLDKEMVMQVLRADGQGGWKPEPVTIKVTPKLVVETDRFGFKHSVGRIGILGPPTAFEMREHTVLSATGAAFGTVWQISVDTLKAIGQMIMGYRSTEELGGILRIGAYAGEFAKQGVVSLITFAALLSVNLGLINLLPIPMLDGGHLAFYAMESVRGKPMGEKFQEYALRVGMVFLFGVMIFATWNDLVQLKIVDYLKNLIS